MSMASTKKSSTEEDEKKKNKKKSSKEPPTKPKKPTAPTKPSQEPTKNKNKTPNGKVLEPKISAVSSSSSGSQDEEEHNSKRSTPKKGNDKKRKERSREENDGDVGEDGSMCRFPTARIKRIMKSEDPDLALGGDVVFLVNKATEMFLEQFCEDGYKCSVRDRKKSLNYNHLASVVSKERRYDFLSDFVPEKLRAEDALSRRKLVETAQG